MAPARRKCGWLPCARRCLYGRFGHTKCYENINDGSIIAHKRGGRMVIDPDGIDAVHASLERIEPKVERRAAG
jgi:hypothetical protein